MLYVDGLRHNLNFNLYCNRMKGYNSEELCHPHRCENIRFQTETLHAVSRFRNKNPNSWKLLEVKTVTLFFFPKRTHATEAPDILTNLQKQVCLLLQRS
jgi:hypothetical protein